MGGGLIQLATKGAEDIYLTGDPEITFFKAVYNKYTHFSRERCPIFFDKNFENGQKSTATIVRNADLVSGITLTFKTNQIKTQTNNAGILVTDRKYSTYINYIDLKIGTNLIDRRYGEFLDMWHELTTTQDKMGGKMHDPKRASNSTAFQEILRTGTLEMMGNALGTYNTASDTTFVVAIPLDFWFNKDTGFALPLISLQFHQVTIEVNFKEVLPADNLKGGNTLGENFTSDEQLLVDYYYLDTPERTMFTETGQEYLIEQLQFEDNIPVTNTAPGSTNVLDFTFNHPVKELFWKLFKSNGETVKRYEYSNITLNGTDLTNPHPSYAFSFIEPLHFHTRIPANGDIFIHSFALRPEELQPSGTMNLSRIEKANLVVKNEPGTAFTKAVIYATSYNVLKIQSGMAGLAFS